MNNLKEMVGKNGLYIKLGALAVTIIGFFLDFLKGTVKVWGMSSSEKVTYFEYKDLVGKDHKGFAVIVLILVIATLVWLLAEKYAKELYEKVPANIAKYVGMALSGVALILTLVDWLTAKSRILDAAGSYAKDLKDYVTISPQIGLFLIVIGLVVAIAVMVYEEFFMGKPAAPAATNPAPVQPTAEAPVENNQQ